ncbi:hypothetical protein L1987_71954 [Smallanthus sonchifolius]|uniref:Uncharacterized protein n=1 Tax=Smallanthus sonchifolius TaxID=185202 RepID=A0ACB9AT19_9ASTR|nr:hypothetical protein L1987_71954 [Smallanthus sonchifolius]
MQEQGLGMMGGGGGIGGGFTDMSVSLSGDQNRHLKAEIAIHPLYEQLLSAHVACLRVATPIDQLPLIDAQLSQSHNLLRSYIADHHNHPLSPHDRQDLDNFLAQYLVVLCSFKEQLQQHVRVHAVEAVMGCREIEHSLQALTGASLGEGSGATMSDDEDEMPMDFSLDQSSGMDGSHDMMGFGPLLPTESERSLMERVRQELKIELKQGFRSKIEDVREEILRKRRAGKLPGDTTSVLKDWWQQHSKWPYPTEDDKAKLVEETGLQLKQINNWFINQRKRNWHSNSNSMNALKSKHEGSRHPQGVEVVPFNTSEVHLKLVLLHGNLDICIKEANKLPNMDSFNKKFTPLSGTSDPYVTVSVANAVIGRTFVINNSENPVWMQHFHVPVAHHTTEVLFVVKDSDVMGSQLIGAVGIPAEHLARRLIYIAGWSIFHKVQLVRYGDKARESILGDLLKSKSDEGVRVLLLVWDDPTSKSFLGYKTEGVMQTHDEETRAFFKNSSVQVLLCPRSISKDAETIYSHNQKTVIVDADAGIKRRIMAFVGGLDLCVGRYDTPEHSLFSTLNTLHKDDYHNPNYTGSTAGCSREPWHDLHCRIEGPAAYDVLKNFEEQIPEILGITDARYTSEKVDRIPEIPEGWHVQVFRSIDSNSVKGLGYPKDPKDAKSKHHTMQMMYEVIYKALQETGLENEYEPQDYLNFFCLGTRESSQGVPPNSNGKILFAPNTPQALSITNRRFMIHVNSKGMIVDHEFVLLGSANINQRSLEGTRDTKIAMGAYQPHHTWARKGSSPTGQIFGYRMSLWAEHIGALEKCFEHPQSLECVRRVRFLGEQNWEQYAADKITDMTAHLLKYPVEVDRKGQVKPLPGCPNFPDVGGSIVGSFVAVQENLTI